MPIFSSTVENIVSDKSSHSYYQFDGVDDYINTAINPVKGSKAIFMWIKWTNLNVGDYQLMGVQRDTKYFYLGMSQNNKPYWYIGNNTGGEVSGFTFEADKWYHYGLVGESFNTSAGGATYSIYINGDVIQTGAYDDYNDSGWDFWIGKLNNGGDGAYPCSCQISSFRYYNYAPSTADVADMYSGKAVPDKHKESNVTDIAPANTATSVGSEANDNSGWNGYNNWGNSVISTSGENAPMGGDYLMKIYRDPDTAYWYMMSDGMTVVPGKAYVCRMVMKRASGSTGVLIAHSQQIWNGFWNGQGVHCFDGVDQASGALPVDTDWHTYTFEFTVPDAGHQWQGTNYQILVEALSPYTAVIYFNTLDVHRIGVLAEYDATGMASDKWFDKSGNGRDGLIYGPTIGGVTTSNSGLIYEEGTFTADLTSSGGGSSSITVNPGYDLCSYTRIGRLVHVHGGLYTSAIDNPTGDLNITGLPYAVPDDAEWSERSAGSFWIYGTTDTGGNPYYGEISGGTSISLSEFTGTTNASMAVHATNAMYISFSLTYHV